VAASYVNTTNLSTGTAELEVCLGIR